MNHQLRDLIIFLISISGLAYLYRSYKRKGGPLVRILCFHDVADATWFESVIKMIKDDFHLITPEEFKQKNFDPNKINVLLTFDDGYQSWIDNCLPILNKYQAKGIFFINSGLLDIAEDSQQVESYMKERLLINPKKALSWAGAKQILNSGHTIGGHTVSHPNLASLELAATKPEIEDDKKKIESILNVRIEDFAYPFGTRSHINGELIGLIKAHYNYQYSAITGFLRLNNNQLINRTLVEKNQSTIHIRRWINGGYDLLKFR